MANITDDIDLTINSLFAGDENYRLFPQQWRDEPGREWMDSEYPGMSFFGQVYTIDVWEFIRMPNFEFLWEVGILYPFIDEQDRIEQDSWWAWRKIFNAHPPWDEESQFYESYPLDCCGNASDFFTNPQEHCNRCWPKLNRFLKEE